MTNKWQNEKIKNPDVIKNSHYHQALPSNFDRKVLFSSLGQYFYVDCNLPKLVVQAYYHIIIFFVSKILIPILPFFSLTFFYDLMFDPIGSRRSRLHRAKSKNKEKCSKYKQKCFALYPNEGRRPRSSFPPILDVRSLRSAPARKI